MNSMPSHWVALLPYLLLAGGGTLIFCVGAFWRRRSGEWLFALALASTVAAGLASALISPGAPSFSGMLDLGIYARYFISLFAAITLLTLLFVRRYARARSFAGDEFYALLLFAALGMTLVAAALNWLIFFLGLELLSLSLYVLIPIHKGQAFANEAGVKYFIMGAVASAFLTFGIALLYAGCGTLEIGPSLAAVAETADLPLILLALSLILVGIGFKISLVPFHLWTPDVYQGAPAPVTAFLSTGSKVALFAALVRFATLVSQPVWLYGLPALWVLAFLTMGVGNITALYQTRLKRLLAYSSVAQMGYLFMTFLAVKQGGLGPLMFYLAVYALMDLGAFGILGTLSGEETDLDALEDCQGLGYSQPWRAGVLATCLVSLAGLPPTAGFMGKFLLFRAVLQAHFLVLAVMGILTVIISIFVYMKVLVSLYMRSGAKALVIPGPDLSIRLAGAVILGLIFWLGLAPSTLLAVIARVISALPV